MVYAEGLFVFSSVDPFSVDKGETFSVDKGVSES